MTKKVSGASTKNDATLRLLLRVAQRQQNRQLLQTKFRADGEQWKMYKNRENYAQC
jgi:hypothetical protein